MWVSKEFKFEMAHKLHKSYTCKCQNIHGHSYRVIVSVKGAVNAQGVVLDFTKLKECISEVFEQLDHACMVCADDKEVVHFLKVLTLGGSNDKLIVCSKEPTAENIALYILHSIKTKLAGPFDLPKFLDFKVELYETATSKVEVSSSVLPSEVIPTMSFYNKSTEWLDKRLLDSFYELETRAVKKFAIHANKGDWRHNPKKLDINNLFHELQGECDELKNYTDTENLKDEAGDIINYLVIILDLINNQK